MTEVVNEHTTTFLNQINLLNYFRTFIVDQLSDHYLKLVIFLVACLKISDCLLEPNVVNGIVYYFKAKCSLHPHNFLLLLQTLFNLLFFI